jgi:hypothetical protein
MTRHPLSAEYADLDSTTQSLLRQSLETHGFLPERPITLYQGAVLDGWQRWQCCQELGIEPVTVEYKGDDPVAYVQAVNDARRHESPESVARRVASRRERVAQRREAGESIRMIAEAEKVAIGTVRSDLNSPGVRQRTPDSDSPVTGVSTTPVTGRDGKQYRKRKAKPEVPVTTIAVPVNAAELADWQAEADRAGLDLVDWVRKCCNPPQSPAKIADKPKPTFSSAPGAPPAIRPRADAKACMAELGIPGPPAGKPSLHAARCR